MTTPEKKVKDKVKKLLEEYGAYYFMPTTGGYGRSGVPDIVACLRGKFIGIECKANGNKPTALQEKNLMKIMDVGGFAVAVDENGIELFKNLLNQIKQSDKIPREAGILFDLLTTKELE
jgi:Holliday junction resolvase